MTKIISFYSYKGGTGRTTTAANFCYQLASEGKKVLAIDLDIDGPGLFSLFDLKKDEVKDKNIVNFLLANGPKNYRDYVHNVILDTVSLDVIPAPMTMRNDESLNTFGNELIILLGELLENASACYDFIVLDTASGISDYSLLAFTFADYSIACFRWSRQHARGTIFVSKLINSLSNNPKFRLNDWLMLPTSVPKPQNEAQNKRKGYVKQALFEITGKETNIEIPEDDKQKWDEHIVLEKETEVFRAYNSLAQYAINHFK